LVSDLVGAIVLIFLVLAFYRLSRSVDQHLAVLVIIFGGVMPALINFVNVVTDAGALMLVQGGGFLSAFDKPQREALASCSSACTALRSPPPRFSGACGSSLWPFSCTGPASCPASSVSGSSSTGPPASH
jgi:hypothetical protein